MTTMSKAQADRIHARTAAIVERMRNDADAAEARGDIAGATALRRTADSRERAGGKAHEGAVIGRA